MKRRRAFSCWDLKTSNLPLSDSPFVSSADSFLLPTRTCLSRQILLLGICPGTLDIQFGTIIFYVQKTAQRIIQMEWLFSHGKRVGLDYIHGMLLLFWGVSSRIAHELCSSSGKYLLSFIVSSWCGELSILWTLVADLIDAYAFVKRLE